MMSRKDLKEMSQSGQGIGRKPILSRQDCFRQSHNSLFYPLELPMQKGETGTYPLAKSIDSSNLCSGLLPVMTIVPSTVDALRKFSRQRLILIIVALMNRRGISAHAHIRIFQWRESPVHVQEVSVHVREASVHVREVSVHVREASVHVHEVSVHVREVSVHVHEASVHVREVSVHVREVSVHVREVSVHVHEVSVHVPKSLMQREKTVIFPVSIPFYEDVPIIGIKQFKLYKST